MTRYEAAKSLGIESIPCIIANDLTPEQAKAFRIADNKVAEQSDWNFFKLSSELAELPDFDMLDFGFSDIELDNLSGLASDFYITEPDDYEEEEQAPQFYKPNLSPQVSSVMVSNKDMEDAEYRQATRYNAPAIAKHMTTVCPNCGEEFEID